MRTARVTWVGVAAGGLVLAAIGLGAPAGAATGGDPTPTPGQFTVRALTPTSTTSTPKSASGRIAESDPSLLRRTDATPVNVMVKLDVDGAASYAGGLPGLAATSPQVTGKPLTRQDPRVAAYLAHVRTQTTGAARAITTRVPSATIGRAYGIAYGGLSVRLPADQAKSLLQVPGVVAVQADTLAHPLADPAASNAAVGNDTTSFVGADKVWPRLGGRDRAGQGVVVADLDTGIWPEHPMLVDKGLPDPRPGKTFGCQFGNGTDPTLGDAFTCNHKLVGAYAFLATQFLAGPVNPDQFCNTVTQVCSARDSDGHGTHTSTTAAGDAVAHAQVLGVDRGPISGLAPGASVIEYRVCLDSGCFPSDSVAAVQQAILDHVDVINFSISGGSNAYTDPVELAFLDAYKANITVSASAGNAGPGAGTSDHAGPWVLTVGASTPDRAFSSTLTLKASDGTTFTKSGSTITQGVTNAPVVLAAKVPGETKNCLTSFPPNSVTGKVVVCERGGGGGGRVEKGRFALAGGAAGMILYNATNQGDTETDNHFLPAIHLEGPNDAMLAFLAAHPDATATWATGQKVRAQGDVMAGFSSRGPVGDFLKPDITAPGVQVLAGHTPQSVDLATGPRGELYQAIAGTSMSAPHSTGIAALVKAAHPSWTAGQIKSALMTSSVQDVVNADGTPATPRDDGAGSIRADRAVSPTLTFDVPGEDYVASAGDPLDRVDLNLPSVKADPLPGSLQTVRTAKNVSGRDQSFKVSATASNGVKVSVSPSRFEVRPGQSQRLRIVLDGTDAAVGAVSFGQITLNPNRNGTTPVVLPIEAVVGQGKVALAHTCSPTTIARGAITQCTVTATNNAPVEAPASVTVTGDDLRLSDATAPASVSRGRVVWSGTLGAALPPTVDSITPADPTDFGYLSLAEFGIDPLPDVSDDSISNVPTSPFQYGSETYDSVGVVSNGYVVVGGGDAADVLATPTAIPDPSTPNNILAPFWTDLDPSAGGAIRVARLSDDAGTNSWIVVDYDHVPAFGTTKLNTFEVWIQEGATEGQWLSYATLAGNAGDASPAAAGAENRTGSSGVALVVGADGTALCGQTLGVQTGPPTPGGSVSFGYRATANRPGATSLVATLLTPVVKGATIAKVPITVTR